MKITFFVIVILFVFCSCEQTTESINSTFADQNEQILYKELSETVIEHNVPGAALLVRFEDGSISKQAYGFAEIGNNSSVKMVPLLKFRIGSVTKTFIGTSILILVKQGKISLDDTLETLLPGIITRGKELTLEMLLDQTSSLIQYTGIEEFVNTYCYNPTFSWTREMILDLFKNEELLDTPGKLSYYSNSNYYLLGIIIEKYSGKSLDNFLADEIFTPLGMMNTYLPIENDLYGDFAHGYFDVNNDGIFTVDEDYTSQSPIAIWAAGGIVSTLDDLLIWSDELFSGSLLNEELQSKRMNINCQLAGAPSGINYGLGIADFGGAVGHNGAVAGYSTILFKYNNTTFIAFGNGYETIGENGLVADDLFERLKATLFN